MFKLQRHGLDGAGIGAGRGSLERLSQTLKLGVTALSRLQVGLSLDGEALKPAKVDWQNPEQLRFVLTEGKKRQIRRMCGLVGLRVVGLKRIRIGRVTLGNLPVGQWRYLGEPASRWWSRHGILPTLRSGDCC